VGFFIALKYLLWIEKTKTSKKLLIHHFDVFLKL